MYFYIQIQCGIPVHKLIEITIIQNTKSSYISVKIKLILLCGRSSDLTNQCFSDFYYKNVSVNLCQMIQILICMACIELFIVYFLRYCSLKSVKKYICCRRVSSGVTHIEYHFFFIR